MHPIPRSPRAEYDALRARVFARSDLAGNSIESLADTAEAIKCRRSVESGSARGRDELDVWIEVCSELVLPLPDWRPEQTRRWRETGSLVVDGAEFRDTASEYANISAMIDDEYGYDFVVLFERVTELRHGHQSPKSDASPF